MSLTQTEQKILSANTAVETLIEKGFIFSGMKIGLGTGSTALPAVKRLSEFIKDGTLKDIKAVVTSFQTENACADWGIPVYSFKDRIINGSLDLAIDGADEIDFENNCIKGGGAALLREKIVAYNAKKFVVVADSSKAVKTLGTKFPLPVEIIGEAFVPVKKALEALGAKVVLREGVKKCGPVITDNGNQIVDCLWSSPVDSKKMEDIIKELKQLPNFKTPVIALTADAISGAEEKYKSIGFVDYLSKPFTKDQIKEKISNIFDASEDVNNIKEEHIENTEVSSNNSKENYLKENNIDYNKGIELFGSIDMYNSMLSDWYKGINDKWNKIISYKNNSDMTNYAIEVHSLKSDSKYFGFTKLAELSYNHELKSKDNDIEYVNNNFSELELEYKRILNIVGNYLSK